MKISCSSGYNKSTSNNKTVDIHIDKTESGSVYRVIL